MVSRLNESEFLRAVSSVCFVCLYVCVCVCVRVCKCVRGEKLLVIRLSGERSSRGWWKFARVSRGCHSWRGTRVKRRLSALS